MVTMQYHFRPSCRDGGREGKIFIRLIYQRQTGMVTLPYSVFREEWDQRHQQLKYRAADPQRMVLLEELNERLKQEKELICRLVSELEIQGGYTVQDVVSRYRFYRQGKGLSALVELLCRELMENGQERTARAYQTTLRMLLAYTGTYDLTPEQFTGTLILRYQKHLQQEKKSLNTISFYMRNLRAIYNKGVKRFYIAPQPGNLFSNAYTQIATTRKRALLPSDIYALEKLLKKGDERLNNDEKKAVAVFLFSFYARGMSFVDIANLRKKDIEGNKITYYRRKTGKFLEIIITPEIRSNMRIALSDHSSPYLFGIIQPVEASLYRQYCSGLQKQNNLLKQVAAKAGISGSLTTHMARHSWATIAKNAQVPISVISEALGHSAITTTYKYLDSFGSSALDQANRKVARAVRQSG